MLHKEKNVLEYLPKQRQWLARPLAAEVCIVEFMQLQHILLQDEIKALNIVFSFHFFGFRVCRGRQDCALRYAQVSKETTIICFISKETYYRTSVKRDQICRSQCEKRPTIVFLSQRDLLSQKRSTIAQVSKKPKYAG